MQRFMGPALIAASVLAGCTKPLNFKPTMASDPPQLGIEGIALANELSKAYYRLPVAAGSQPSRGQRSTSAPICQDLRLGYQEAEKFSVARYKTEAKNARDLFGCVFFVDPTPARVADHISAGLALSDYFCDNFFERVAEHSGKRKFARNVTNDVGTLVSTVLGLAAAGSGVTGGIGAGFGLLDSSWRNYDDSFLVSADLPTLQKLVYSEQDKFRARLKPQANFPDATNVILRYANLCSFVGMKALLTNSMSQKTDANIALTAGPDDLVKARAAEFVKAYEEAQAARAASAKAAPPVTPQSLPSIQKLPPSPPID